MRLHDVRAQAAKRRGEPHDRGGCHETAEIDDVNGDPQTLQALGERAGPGKHDGQREAVAVEPPREHLEITLAASPLRGAGDVDHAERAVRGGAVVSARQVTAVVGRLVVGERSAPSGRRPTLQHR